MKKDKKNCYFVRYEQLQFNDRLTYMHTYGHGDSMTNRAQRAESVKMPGHKAKTFYRISKLAWVSICHNFDCFSRRVGGGVYLGQPVLLSVKSLLSFLLDHELQQMSPCAACSGKYKVWSVLYAV